MLPLAKDAIASQFKNRGNEEQTSRKNETWRTVRLSLPNWKLLARRELSFGICGKLKERKFSQARLTAHKVKGGGDPKLNVYFLKS